MIKNKEPLVSIIVITYNSSEYVTETLESAYHQTYKGPIELIISDDCSTDNTIEICRKWLDSHYDRFVRTIIIASQENQGVSKNINAGCYEAKGEWIKPIAGDDILLNDCIENNLIEAEYIGEDCVFIMSDIIEFEDYKKLSIPKKEKFKPYKPYYLDINYYVDYPLFTVCGPCFFLKKEMLEKIGYYPEIERNLEDVPLTRKVISEGYTIHQITTKTCAYRVREESLIHSLNITIPNRAFINSYRLFIKPKLTIKKRLKVFLTLWPKQIETRFKGKHNLIVSSSFLLSRMIKKYIS